MKPKKKREDYFVVYTVPIGRQKVGIRRCTHVVFVEDKAIVYVNGESRADIVPKANVFADHDSAAKYLAGHGVRRWVVGEVKFREEHRREVPVMFEALVVHYDYNGRYRHENKIAVKRIDGGKEPVDIENTYGFRSYETKREAEKEFTHRWRQRWKDAEQNLLRYKEYMLELMKNPPRKRSKTS
jgi:hypothetical protein